MNELPGAQQGQQRALCDPTAPLNQEWVYLVAGGAGTSDEFVKRLGEQCRRGRGSPRARHLLATSHCFKWTVSLCKSSYNLCV